MTGWSNKTLKSKTGLPEATNAKMHFYLKELNTFCNLLQNLFILL